ncbi:hypothetical protein BN381_490007 [Candidatus Microthrix parvicella RN1]|uniref:Uncharacterized protein n=1 Tax=Candidatus Neomicrothrix parvicella RN1 TaxID=1229780 RepID=R4Z2B2_9ACTN|nr:hypothetical protein BN381_490007 [Candidatus Microthrix parvicella RN1]
MANSTGIIRPARASNLRLAG